MLKTIAIHEGVLFFFGWKALVNKEKTTTDSISNEETTPNSYKAITAFIGPDDDLSRYIGDIVPAECQVSILFQQRLNID